ncbi:MAG TPA: hypothetical protein VH165_30730 [Kofleriaceae bacterium]|jgi:hypothetical protein|nr:hypothetical protein [Kofleriaceae bacterium]
MKIESSWIHVMMLTAALAGCDSTSDAAGPDAAPALRPGIEDSNQVFKGTPDAHESAFWVAVRDADEAGRAAVASQLVTDVAADPSNGYSAFLIAVSSFMAPNAVLQALAGGTPPPAFNLAPATPYLEQGLAHLTDPFYLGFDGGLLASVELSQGDVADGGPRFATAVMNNQIATGLIAVIGDLHMQNAAKALDDMYALLEDCNAGPLDRAGGDAAAYVAKQNAGMLAQRECYSGYHAPHGSPGELLILADLHAITGNADAARAYYSALKGATDYATWPLAPLVERRLSGAQPADLAGAGVITSTCATCHSNTLP